MLPHFASLLNDLGLAGRRCVLSAAVKSRIVAQFRKAVLPLLIDRVQVMRCLLQKLKCPPDTVRLLTLTACHVAQEWAYRVHHTATGAERCSTSSIYTRPFFGEAMVCSSPCPACGMPLAAESDSTWVGAMCCDARCMTCRARVEVKTTREDTYVVKGGVSHGVQAHKDRQGWFVCIQDRQAFVAPPDAWNWSNLSERSTMVRIDPERVRPMRYVFHLSHAHVRHLSTAITHMMHDISEAPMDPVYRGTPAICAPTWFATLREARQSLESLPGIILNKE